MTDRVKFLRLFGNESKGGKEYFSYNLSPYTKLLAWINENESGKRHIDIYVAPREQKEEDAE